MTRVKRGNVARKRRKKVLKITEGFRGSSSLLFRPANQQKIQALKYSYRDRNQRKREFRRLWTARMNAAVRLYGLNYSEFLHGLKKANMFLNRKMLSQIAILDSLTFKSLIEMTN